MYALLIGYLVFSLLVVVFLSYFRMNRILRVTLMTSLRTASTSTIPGHIKVFDREMKRRQRNWAVKSDDFNHAQRIREECGYLIADRVFDLTKFNEVCIDLGCGCGYIAPHLIKENVGLLIQCDISEEMVKKAKEATSNSEVVVPFNHIPIA